MASNDLPGRTLVHEHLARGGGSEAASWKLTELGKRPGRSLYVGESSFYTGGTLDSSTVNGCTGPLPLATVAVHARYAPSP